MADRADQIRESFKKQVGRDPTEAEIKLVDQQAGGLFDKGQTIDSISGAYADLLKRAESMITKEAKASNVTLTSERAKEIAGDLIDPTRVASWSLADGRNRDNYISQARELVPSYVNAAQVEQIKNPTVTDDFKTQAAEVLQSVYGRDGTTTEINYFAKQLAQGYDPFELGEMLKQTTEYQKIQADAENQRVQTESAAARESLNAELLKGEEEAFARAQPEIISSFMKAGVLNTSGLSNAVARARADLARERQGFLANAGYGDAIRAQGYGREDFVNRNASAFQQYLRQSEPRYQSQFAFTPGAQYGVTQGLAADRLNRARSLQDYGMQRNDYERYLAQSGQGNGFAGAVQGGLSGAMAGGQFGGGPGALLGGLYGAGLGYYANRR